MLSVDVIQNVASVRDCELLCLRTENFTCHSIVYGAATYVCTLTTHTHTSAPDSWNDSPNLDYNEYDVLEKGQCELSVELSLGVCETL